MIHFSQIIREAGYNPEGYPKASNIVVTLYDGNDNVSDRENISFLEKLFAHNYPERRRFYQFLNRLENSSIIPSMNVMIDEKVVCLFYKTSHPKMFFR